MPAGDPEGAHLAAQLGHASETTTKQSYIAPGLYAMIICTEYAPNEPDRGALALYVTIALALAGIFAASSSFPDPAVR